MALCLVDGYCGISRPGIENLRRVGVGVLATSSSCLGKRRIPQTSRSVSTDRVIAAGTRSAIVRGATGYARVNQGGEAAPNGKQRLQPVSSWQGCGG